MATTSLATPALPHGKSVVSFQVKWVYCKYLTHSSIKVRCVISTRPALIGPGLFQDPVWVVDIPATSRTQTVVQDGVVTKLAEKSPATNQPPVIMSLKQMIKINPY